MGNCASAVTCDAPEGAIEVLPDIVGIGILTSFLVTAGAAFVTMFVGYFMDFLPGDFLNWADWGFLQGWSFRKCCRNRYKGNSSGSSLDLKPCNHMDPTRNSKRHKSLIAFILTLSDQQLVTGPAMIIAALSQRCEISSYEFQVVNSLAWLASSTHLATLIILRQYFRENKVVRNIRVVGMLVNLSLLLYTTVMTSASYYVENSVGIQCVMDNLPKMIPTGLDLINLLVTVLFLVQNYGESISQLYNEHHLPFRNWLGDYCCVNQNGPQLNEEQFEQWYTINVVQSRYRPESVSQREHMWRTSIAYAPDNENTPQRFVQKVRQRSFAMLAIFHDYRGSFLGEIPGLLLTMSYGITQVVFSRTEAPSIKGSENTVDFGQIVPLFLLALPVLAVVENIFQEDYEMSYSKQTPQMAKAKLVNQVETPTDDQARQNLSHDSGNGEETPNSEGIELSQMNGSKSSLPPPIWISLPSGTPSRRPIISSLAQLDGFNLAIAVNPKLLYPYAIPFNQRCLSSIFFISAAISIETGVMLWLSSGWSIMYAVLVLSSLVLRTIEYAHFVVKILKEVTILKRKARSGGLRQYLEQAGGIRAAPPSIFEGTDATTITQEPEQEESLEITQPSFDPTEVDGMNRIIQALPPPLRRQTTGFEANEGQSWAGRRPARNDTESNVGLEP